MPTSGGHTDASPEGSASLLVRSRRRNALEPVSRLRRVATRFGASRGHDLQLLTEVSALASSTGKERAAKNGDSERNSSHYGGTDLLALLDIRVSGHKWRPDG